MGRGRRRPRVGLVCLAFVSVVVGSVAPASASSAASVPTPSTSPEVARPVAEITSAAGFAVELLRQGQWPVTGANICGVLAWEAAEGGHFVQGASRFNPLNTTQSMPGDSIFNSVGVRNYPDWQTGLDATIKTLSLGFYDAIRKALTDGRDAGSILSSVSASVWGTKFEGGQSVSGQCLSWAGEFDRRREVAVERVAAAAAEVSGAESQVVAATREDSALTKKYQGMKTEIGAAQAKLARFARSLYISGAEPEVMSKLDAVTSGDPVGFEVLKSYPGISARRDAGGVDRSLDLLAQVAESRQAAADALGRAEASRQTAIAKKTNADEQLAEAERDGLPS